MKINGKILKEGFANILDSSTIDYTEQFEKKDKEYIQRSFIDSIYVFNPYIASINFMENFNKPDTAKEFAPLTKYLPDEYKPTLEITEDNINIILDLKGNVSTSFFNKIEDLFEHLSEKFLELIYYFSADTISYNMNFIQGWTNKLDGNTFINYPHNFFTNAFKNIKQINDYLNSKVLVLSFNKDLNEVFSGKTITLTYKMKSGINEIIRNSSAIYLELIEYFKKKPEKLINYIKDATWLNNRSIYGTYDNFYKIFKNLKNAKDSDSIIKELNKLNNVFEINTFFLYLTNSNIDKLLDIIKNSSIVNDFDTTSTYIKLFIALSEIPPKELNELKKDLLFNPIHTKILWIRDTI